MPDPPTQTPEPDPPGLRPSRRRPGWRRRRLRRTIQVLTALAVGALLVGWVLARWRRPSVRRPGEKLEDITESLSKGLPPDAPAPRFTDVTAAAGLDGFRSFRGSRSSQLPEDMGSGLAWGDYDNDGDDDLFVVAAGGSLELAEAERAPSILYENLGDGRFREVAEFPAPRVLGMAAAWGDADGDGWLDLVLTGYRTLRLYRNHRGRLELDPSFPELDGYWAGAAWGDFDNDGDLDLYVCGYVRYEVDAGARARVSEQYGAAVPFTLNPASFEPERNLLLQNRGDGTFQEVAALYGVSNPEGRSLSALWHDFDDDGRLDLYVANDISDNALFLNRGDTFEDAGLTAWVADYRGAMGLAAGDWNRDGDDDLFITHWIAQENALYDSHLADFRQRGGPPRPLSFSDLSAPLGLGQIALQVVGWGTEFADLDADGWLDLVVANGSTLETRDTPKRLKPQPDMLLWNRHGEGFHDLASLVPALATPRVSRGLALSDYDLDGDLDLAILHLDGGVLLLRNDMQQGHWLELRLRSRPLQGDGPRGRADGTTVILRAGGTELRRTVGGSSYLSQSSRTLHFGLGATQQIDGIEVRWLGGETETFGPLAVDALWELREGDPEPRRVETVRPASPTVASLDREGVKRFWALQRSAMDAMKREGDIPRAIELFRQALELKPDHQDSRYYLGNCLAIEGRLEEALAQFDILRRANPQSHRAHKQWGVLRALTARGDSDLAAAEAALERALDLNPEETGALLVLGEIALLRGDPVTAAQRLEWACRSNPKAVGGFFLRAYIAWKAGDTEQGRELLRAARAARGPDWKPEGAVAEGDVAARMHRETSPLARFWESWDGDDRTPARVFESLDRYLATLSAVA